MVVCRQFSIKSTYRINRAQTTVRLSLQLKAVAKSYWKKFAKNCTIHFAQT